ncbi:MAG TPA: FkbM family methyltransferase [Planctomycetaceae bacterium]|nr:FkbM family methyltransferase [Planctomycetaceae bacterium]
MNVRSLVRRITPSSLLNFHRKRFAQQSNARRIAHLEEVRHWHRNAMWMSQAGQDLWVYGSVFNEMKDGFFVDLGAHDGIYLSNTFILEQRYHWRGILIEANPETFEVLSKNRTACCINACVSSQVEKVRFLKNSTFGGIVASDCDNNPGTDSGVEIEMETVPLESLLDSLSAPSVIEYLSVDIEGAEDRALLEFPFDRYTFLSATIERPSEKLCSVLNRNGYRLVCDIPGLDCYYIHESHADAYFKNTLDFHRQMLRFQPERGADAQLYCQSSS